ncbi:MAG: methyltransferase domain-containing protein [Acidobacteriota bacterium]|nr:methyltransferase domain-containing protein [Acidobacteriota bacterium]
MKQFLTRNKEIGAVAESSDGLAELITDCASVETAKVVLELGPGTGVFTEKILQKMSNETVFFALEVNPRFVEATKRRCPQGRVYHDTAVNARKYMDELGVTHCDAIVSGLPWASFSDELQDDILDAVLDALKPGGTFATFAYLRGDKTEPGQQFRRKLHNRFSDVELSRTVWKNIPPAFVYRARSPE